MELVGDPFDAKNLSYLDGRELLCSNVEQVSVVDSIIHQAEDMRMRLQLADNSPIEVDAPRWLRGKLTDADVTRLTDFYVTVKFK